MRVEVSKAADKDLEDIGDYIAGDNPVRAVSFINELRTACMHLGESPLATQARLELGENLRSRPHGSYLIIFKIEPESVLILRVLHGARNLPPLLFEGESVQMVKRNEKQK